MNDLKQTLMIALASFAAMTTTARAEFPEKPITLVEEPLISAPGREGSGSEAAPPWMPQNTIKVAGILSQCLPSGHRAVAELARSKPICKSGKFSDHAPVTIEYDRGF